MPLGGRHIKVELRHGRGLLNPLPMFALFVAIASFPVINLAAMAAGYVWSGMLPITKATFLVAVIALPFFALALALTCLMPENGARFTAALAWFALGFVHFNWLRTLLTSLGWVDIWQLRSGLLVLAAFAVWIGVRFDPEARHVMTFVSVFLALQLAVLAFALARVNEPAPVAGHAAPLAVGRSPSIWFIVLDSHGSPKALRDLNKVDLSGIISRYEIAGFRVWDDARSNFSQTLLSIPSMLSGEIWSPELIEDSYAAMLAGTQGNTPLVRSLKDTGFTVRMAPANWSRSGCGKTIDECFNTSRFDDHWYFLLRSTPLPHLFPNYLARVWPGGDLRSLEEINNIAASDDVGKHFTFVHSLASHAPMVLNESCDVVAPTDVNLKSQLQCTHDTLLEGLNSIDLSSDIVIITADHGYPEGDMSGDPEEWNGDTTWGRFSAFTAISTPDGCEESFPDRLSGGQILPLVLNCYGGNLMVPPNLFMKAIHQKWGGLTAAEFTWDGWSPYSP